MFEMRVYGKDFPGDRRNEFMNRGYGFNLGEDLSRLDLVSHVGKLDRNHAAERSLNVISETKVNLPILHSNPNMLFADFDFFLFHNLFYFSVHYRSCLPRVKTVRVAAAQRFQLDKFRSVAVAVE